MDLRRESERKIFADPPYRAVVVERFMLMTAYVMRKLTENDQLTVEMVRSKWPAQEFRCIVPPPHRKWFQVSEDGKHWRQPLEDHYDLTNPSKTRLSFTDICNWIVHHFAFEVRSSDEATIEILFNSDRTTDRLFLIMLEDYTHIVEEVAYDEAMWADMNRYEGRVLQYRQRPPGM